MAEASKVPANLRYSKDHEWVRMEGSIAIVGITDHAQHALGDVTYVDLPPVGKQVRQGQELSAVESAKAAADVFSPLSGTVSEVNSALESEPERVNTDPYGAGWICKLKDVQAADLNNLLSTAQYRELREKQEP